MLHEDYEDYVEMARALLGGFETHDDLLQANQCINFALQLRPKAAKAWLLKSQILSAIEDEPAAVATIEKALSFTPYDAEALFVKATIQADLGELDEAMQTLDLAFNNLNKDDIWLLEDLYFEKGTILEELQRPEEAIATFEAGLARCPNSDLLRVGLQPFRREKLRSTLKVINGGLSMSKSLESHN